MDTDDDGRDDAGFFFPVPQLIIRRYFVWYVKFAR
jgi:hypothetical protein